MNSAQISLQRSFEAIKSGRSLSPALCKILVDGDFTAAQRMSLTIRLSSKEQNAAERTLFESWIRDFTDEERALIALWRRDAVPKDLPAYPPLELPLKILHEIKRNHPIKDDELKDIMDRFSAGQISDVTMTGILVAIQEKGISNQSTNSLTAALVSTGSVNDLRPEIHKQGRVLVRRYPTGGLSEKVALILPSLISYLSDVVKWSGVFLVARTLGFTGGTRDKLSVIPGFSFPQSDEEILRILSAGNAAVSTTGPEIAPGDNLLYQLRSETGTIESFELIVSSIVSKHLALPVDKILFDVRFGQGAFIRDHAAASELGDALIRGFDGDMTNASYVSNSNEELNGSSVGNALELAEALVVMGASNKILDFHPAGIEEQRRIVCEQCRLILESIGFDLTDKLSPLLRSGKILSSFIDLGVSHGGNREFLETICASPFALVQSRKEIPIQAEQTGIVREIDQRNLGYFINFGLNKDRSLLGQEFSSFQILKFPGEPVAADETIGRLFVRSDEEVNSQTSKELRDCFLIC